MVKNLKQLRMQRGISQQKLGDYLGISQQSINKYENHSIEPDIHTLMLLADYFQTSVDYLIGHTEIQHPIEPVQPWELNSEEEHLLLTYRKLDKMERESIQFVINNYNRHRP